MNSIKSFVLGVVLASYAASPVWALSIADVPLFQSTTVAPNVMLLVDNSGSMENMIQPAGVLLSDYPAVAYLTYSDYKYSYVYDSLDDGNISLSSVERDDCPSGYKALWSNGSGSWQKRCYLFPDPVGSGGTRYTGKYLAYIFNTFTSANNDLTAEPDSAVPKTFRMQVARDSAKGIVQANRAMRMGLATFNAATNENSGPGGSIVRSVKNLSSVAGVTQAQADQNHSDIVASIDALTPEANTPLAESYYEVTRYFRGLGRDQGSGTGNYTSPIEYRCQKNFGIVVTDGLPTHDRSFPSDDPDRDNPNVDGGNNLPNWDGLQTAFGQPYSDGEAPDDSNSNGESSTLFLDDIAKFAFDIDLRGSGSDQATVSFNDPDFLKQNMITYAVGFAVDNQMLRDTAVYGHGEYYTASNAAQLNDALSRALQSIKERTSSAAAIATNSTRLDTDTLIYQAKFNSGDWSGELIAYGINTNGTVGSARWRTGTAGLIPSSTTRNVYTRNASTGVAFQWANLSAAQQGTLSNNATDGAVVVDWLRGGSSGATLSSASSSEVLRNRTTVLGDIVNSDPVFVGAQSYGYTVPNDPLVTTEPADSYQAYVDAKAASGATKTVIVGANDGMLHAFNAETGSELFAYVPSSLYAARTGAPGATPGLRYLTKSTYTHKYYVDGAIGVGDVYDSAWKTYAVGGLGAGGRGIYALNISTPAGFSASDALWEITAPDTNTTSNNWNDLGYTYGAPIIVRTQDSSNPWVAIFSNGYGSNTGAAALYVVNAGTGALIKKIVVDTNTTADIDNGLSAPSAIVDANRKLTAVYAGDLKGNLWKFDFSSSSSSSWAVAYTNNVSGGKTVSVPLFSTPVTIVDGVSKGQPITSGLEIGAHPISGQMIYFGTGKYFETSDNTVGGSPQKQSFYGIWDKTGNSNATNTNGGPITDTRSSILRQQTITSESGDYRVVSTTAITTASWASLRGWYLDLVPPSGTAAGERAVSLPLLRAGRIIFTTVIPSPDPCLAGGTSWLMELDAFTGGNLNYAVLDTNGDGEFNSADQVVAGMRSREGIIKTPGIVSAGDTEYKYSGGSSGNILVITEKGSSKEGRMSWRQLR